jgi:hypothetical protein
MTSIGKAGEYYVEVPFQVWINDDRTGEKRQLACAILERRQSGGNPDGEWDPGTSISETKEYIVIFNQSYDPQGRQNEYVGYITTSGTNVYAKLSGWEVPLEANFSTEQRERANSPWFDALYIVGLERKTPTSFYKPGDKLIITNSYVLTERDTFYYKSKKRNEKLTVDEKKSRINRINVFPNPYYESLDMRNVNNGELTFSNLPEEVTIKIYTLSGILVKTLSEMDKETISSPFIRWNLENEDGYKVGSGVYLAVVKTKYGEKILKFSVVRQKRF